MARPFRFGVQVSSLDPARWRDELRHFEAAGFSSVFWPDHFGVQWEPVAALAAAAAATDALQIGSLVYDIDYRHPVVLAKAAATIHLLSGGRHEFGIGAGWMESDYVEAGIPFDRAGVRIARLAEALEIIVSMWTREKTSFAGKHYTIRDVARAAPLPEGSRPKILIGGGGRKLLALAGRTADIVGINPKVSEGRVLPDTPADLTPERVREKVAWVREAAAAAGRDPGAIELNALSFVVAVTDDPKPLREALARGSGMTPEQVADSPMFLTGSAPEICERLERRRDETGISYVVIQGRDRRALDAFAEGVVARLAGR
jgi:probable F420-dependent oxidoreductase